MLWCIIALNMKNTTHQLIRINKAFRKVKHNQHDMKFQTGFGNLYDGGSHCAYLISLFNPDGKFSLISC